MFVHPARYVASLHGGIEVSGTIYRTQILDNKQKTQHSSLKMAREEPRKVSRLSYVLGFSRCAVREAASPFWAAASACQGGVSDQCVWDPRG